jgi:hypothetical protein
MSVLRHLGQDQSEIEVSALLAADTNEKLHYQRGRISALLWFADLPQRVALAMKESYDRADSVAAERDRPADYSAHWGSPNFASEWGRRPSGLRTSPTGSGNASAEPGGTLTG